MRYSKSDSTHHSAKLVLTKCLRQAGMGQPNQGLVSQQDKRQPSFPHLRGCPFQTTTYCEPVHMSAGADCFLLQQQTAKSHCTPRTEGLLPRRSVLKAKGNPTCRAGREGTRHDNKTLRGEGCLGHYYAAQYSLFLTNKKESLNTSKRQGLSQGQAVENHWLNYSVLGLSFWVGYFFLFCFEM